MPPPMISGVRVLAWIVTASSRARRIVAELPGVVGPIRTAATTAKQNSRTDSLTMARVRRLSSTDPAADHTGRKSRVEVHTGPPYAATAGTAKTARSIPSGLVLPICPNKGPG